MEPPSRGFLSPGVQEGVGDTPATSACRAAEERRIHTPDIASRNRDDRARPFPCAWHPSSLAPLLRDLECRVDLEMHGDETSFEVIRLIEEIGPDVVGVTLDVGNLFLSGDVPMAAIGRLAPYVHATHCKDGILYRTEEGIVQQLRPVGEGVVDWDAALMVLSEYSPDLHLSFEDYRAENLVRFYDPQWRAHFPDLTDDDVAEFERSAKGCEDRMARGDILDVEAFRKLPFGHKERMESYQMGARHLRNIIEARGLG